MKKNQKHVYGPSSFCEICGMDSQYEDNDIYGNYIKPLCKGKNSLHKYKQLKTANGWWKK